MGFPITYAAGEFKRLDSRESGGGGDDGQGGGDGWGEDFGNAVAVLF